MATWGVSAPKGNLPDFILSAAGAMTYVTDPAIWPLFVAYIAEHHPDAGDLDGKRLVVAHHVLDLLRAWGYAQ